MLILGKNILKVNGICSLFFHRIYRHGNVSGKWFTSIFLFFALFLEIFGWMTPYFLCAFTGYPHALCRFSSVLSARPGAKTSYQLVSPLLKMQMTINTLLDTCDCQLRETSCVIKITIVVCFLIFNLKWFAEGLS